jgi:hypothetical protein
MGNKEIQMKLRKDPVEREISFDGFKFWFRDEPLGEICEEHKCQSPVPKKVIDAYKHNFIDQIIRVGDIA